MKIDIEDINYLMSHEDLNVTAEYSARFYNVLVGCKHIVLRGMYSLPLFFKKDESPANCDYLFIAFTGNNRRALQPIHDGLQNSKILDSSSLKKYCFWSMFFIPFVLVKYLIATGYMKKAYASEFFSFCCSYGCFIEAKSMLKKMNVKAVIVANDHSFQQRSFFRAAQSLNIKTAYVQHASVTENFPPLEFDYAFLDGQESYDKYTSGGKICKSKVFLTGNPRFDIIKSFNSKDSEKDNLIKCGIAINKIDNIQKIKELINKLNADVENIKITLRPHPLMDISVWHTFAVDNDCNISDSKTENPFMFINKNDVFISGESSFHLDAALAGKISYYHNFTEKNSPDRYGYLRSGLVKKLSDNFDELTAVKECSHARLKILQFYAANYGTPDWGHSADLIKGVLENLIQ